MAAVQASRLGDSRDGPRKVGLAKPEGLGKAVRVKADQGAWCCWEGGRRGPGSLWGVRAGQWGRGQARGMDSGSLEPSGPGPSQTLRFRRRRGPGMGGQVWAHGKGRGRLPFLLGKSGSSRELTTCRDTMPKSSQL